MRQAGRYLPEYRELRVLERVPARFEPRGPPRPDARDYPAPDGLRVLESVGDDRWAVARPDGRLNLPGDPSSAVTYSQAMADQRNIDNQSFQDEELNLNDPDRTATIANAVNNNAGVVGVNQNTGNMNSQVEESELRRITFEGQEGWQWQHAEENFCILVYEDPEFETFVAMVSACLSAVVV
mgnify:CR=1 FL=1